MARVRLNDPVRHQGEITTIAELADRGLIEFNQVERFGNRGVTKYFADIKGTQSGWEIGRTAYLSRTDPKRIKHTMTSQ